MRDPSALPLYSSFRDIRGRYDRKSLAALVFVILNYILISWMERGYLTIRLRIFHDHLLQFTWAAMTALLCWDVRPRRDVPLFLVGTFGGFAIEYFGTYCGVWSYPTGDKPPLGIVPCWPIAALAIDRIARLLSPLFLRLPQPEALYHLCVGGFIAAMGAFIWPPCTPTQAVLILAALAWLSWREPRPRADLCLFLGGSLLGVPIEFWGTRRPCWIYYTHQTPATVAIFAHGFCAVAFSRGVQVFEAGLELVLQRRRKATDSPR